MKYELIVPRGWRPANRSYLGGAIEVGGFEARQSDSFRKRWRPISAEKATISLGSDSCDSHHNDGEQQ